MLRKPHVGLQGSDSKFESPGNLVCTKGCGKEVSNWSNPNTISQTPLRIMASQIPPAPRNVIFFGIAGAGKSSIVNMLLGEKDKKAPVSNGALGCTFSNDVYSTDIEGKDYRFYDTAGLGEGSAGTIVSADALVQLYHLLHSLEDGVSLLVYCTRGPRITESLERNYKIFYDGFCRKNVPIVMVVTGLENHDPMESWWEENGERFTEYKMSFDGHACITASRGKQMANGVHKYHMEYNESSVILRDLIVESCLQQPWKMETQKWFVSVVKWFHRNMPSWLDDRVDPRLADLYDILKNSIPEKEAREIARKADTKKHRTTEKKGAKEEANRKPWSFLRRKNHTNPDRFSDTASVST
ncbi:hypothetical protein D9757_002160 [Collybiopsis confluens]|uniref:G domain-containing protein n=1 Tax=Collybiopsis confluens TaxID=2823264 RepID=A0A8H5I013_9AGAR|nr:hypothetical protein D9757_002160 [Collybiopsis confluens]